MATHRVRRARRDDNSPKIALFTYVEPTGTLAAIFGIRWAIVPTTATLIGLAAVVMLVSLLVA
jgi:hypothetical protein